MAKNKSRAREERWQRKRESMSPPDSGRVRPYRGRGRRYNYADQLKMIVPENVDRTRENLVADRAELLVTLNITGAKFFVLPDTLWGNLPLAQSRIEDGEGVAPTLDDLHHSPIYFSVSVDYSANRWIAGERVEEQAQCGMYGVAMSVEAWPLDRPANQLVQYRFLRYDGHTWGTQFSRGKFDNYAGAQFYGMRWLLDREGWDE